MYIRGHQYKRYIPWKDVLHNIEFLLRKFKWFTLSRFVAWLCLYYDHIIGIVSDDEYETVDEEGNEEEKPIKKPIRAEDRKDRKDRKREKLQSLQIIRYCLLCLFRSLSFL